MRHPERDQKVALPTREGIIGTQIANVLNIIQCLNPFLLYTPHREIDGTPTGSPDMDKEAAVAAANTFIHACECLDTMLKDANRWNLTAHDELYRSMNEVNEAQKKFLESQRAASEIVTRPSFNLRPKLLMTTNEFIAYWGDPLTTGMAIIGHGATPEEALKSFDEAFKKTPDQQVASIASSLGYDLQASAPPAELETPPPTSEPAEPPKPTKKKRK